MKKILDIIYKNIRNLVYYRKERQMKPSPDLYYNMNAGNPKFHLTNAFLSAVGMKVGRDDEKIPKYVLLSKVQKKWRVKVKEHGYNAILIDQ